MVPLLRRDLPRPAQRSLPRARRLSNLAGTFTADPGMDLTGLTVGIVDDVCTTGATLGEAARALKARGAADVFGCVFARRY